MSHASITALVDAFSNGDADAIAVGHYYTRLTHDLARAPWFVSATVVPITADNPTYTLPDEHVKLVGAFYDDRLLELIDLRALESLSPTWRDHVGAPLAYTVEDLASAKSYRLYPKPAKPSGAFIFVYGSPLGLDYPPYAVLLLHTEIRSTLLDWMDLPAAWSILAREYGHESNHRDDALADFSQQLSDLLWSMVA